MRPRRIAATLAAMRIGIVAALLLALCAGRAEARGVDLPLTQSLRAYHGTGSWVSIYDTAAWKDPAAVARRLAAHHVDTLYLETSNDRQDVDVVHPEVVAQFIEAAHARDIDVVGWYLPSFTNVKRDVRRALAGARFHTATGDGFDAFALDIESTKIRSIPKRTRRAVAFAAAVRRGLPWRYPLGAITMDPVGGRYWPGYPFAQLARSVDVFLPMAYFTARTSGARHVRSYSAANIAAIRQLVANPQYPVHPIGGESQHASLGELRAFFRASETSTTLGASLWEYGQTTPAQWALLARS